VNAMQYIDIARISGITALIYFTLIFLGVLAYTFWPSNRKRFDDAAAMPLRED